MNRTLLFIIIVMLYLFRYNDIKPEPTETVKLYADNTPYNLLIDADGFYDLDVYVLDIDSGIYKDSYVSIDDDSYVIGNDIKYINFTITNNIENVNRVRIVDCYGNTIYVYNDPYKQLMIEVY